MSKFDNLFNKPVTRNIECIPEKKHNNFISKSEEVKKQKDYNLMKDEFPDLAPKKTVSNKVDESNMNKKYSDITLIVNEVAEVKINTVLPGWTQYTLYKKTGKIETIYGSKTKRQLEQEKDDAKAINSLHNYREMITTLEHNWSRYKKQYDKIHGEGAYDLLYRFQPVYPEDENLSDVEKDHEYEYEYENNEYDSNSQDDFYQKKYSVNSKQ